MNRQSVKVIFGNGLWAHCIAIDTGKSLELYEIARDLNMKTAKQWTKIFPSRSMDDLNDSLKTCYSGYNIKTIHPLSRENVHDIKFERINSVKNDTIDDAMAIEYYGFKQKALDAIKLWYNNSNNASMGIFKRSQIDRYLKKFGRISLRDAGFQLGMTEESIKKILEIMKKDSLNMPFYDLKSGLIEAKFREYISSYFYAEKVYGNINDLNDYLHEKIESKSQFTVEKEYCFVSRVFQGMEKQYPYCYDAILFRPISLKYSIPIRTNRPQMFSEDRISLYSYYLYKEEFDNIIWVDPDIELEVKNKITSWWSDEFV